MENFANGPFEYIRRGRAWELHYGSTNLGHVTPKKADTQAEIIEALAERRSAFIADLRSQHAAEYVHLIDYESGDSVAAFPAASWPQGMTPGLINDSSRYWLRSADRLHSKPVTLSQFAGEAAEHYAPPQHWIAGLLTDDVLTQDAANWRAPTSWEIRHLIGEGSLTGLTGAKVAVLLGVTPQNLRKYTAADGAATRQKMSFAMWHLLLHKLGVQRAD